jgi:hypothetical protein
MTSVTTTMRKASRGRPPHGVARALTCTALCSAGLVTVLLTTAARTDTALGAPGYWAWVLTGLQVAALWGSGVGRSWGWPLGASVQPAWIAYALVTGQIGFIPGCLASGTVQTMHVVRETRRHLGPRRATQVRRARGRSLSSTAPATLARFEV